MSMVEPGQSEKTNHSALYNEEQRWREALKDMTLAPRTHASKLAQSNFGFSLPVNKDLRGLATTGLDAIDPVSQHHRHDVSNSTTQGANIVDEPVKSTKHHLFLHHRSDRKLSAQLTSDKLPFHFRRAEDHKPDHNSPNAATSDYDLYNTPRTSFWHNIKVMICSFPYWNMAFWSGWSYSWGSLLFILSSACSWTATNWPDTEFKGETKYGVPLTFFFGACLYQIGGVMAYLEAVNDGCFAGPTMKRLLQNYEDGERKFLDAKLHAFFGHLVPHHHHHHHHPPNNAAQHQNLSSDNEKPAETNPSPNLEKSKPEDSFPTLLAKASSSHDSTPFPPTSPPSDLTPRRGGQDYGPAVPPQDPHQPTSISSSTPGATGQVTSYLTWQWYPSRHALLHTHLRSPGYLACTIQLFGVTLYGVTSVVILPGIFDKLEWWQTLTAYWIPQVVASGCFLAASVISTVMAQGDGWWKWEPTKCAWWIGVWALAGSMGFLMSAVFGLHSNTHTWATYQSSLSATWGSFLYMLSGLFQWYEAIDASAGPVLAFPNQRVPTVHRGEKGKARRGMEEDGDPGNA